MALGNEERELSSVPGDWAFGFRAVEDWDCQPVHNRCFDL